jgi:hypothetical protein
MSRLIARILLSIFVFPLGGLLYTVTVAVMEQAMRTSGYRYSTAALIYFTVAGGVTWLAVGAYWVLLWRKSVRWTSQRITGTWGAVAGATVVGVLAGSAVSGIDSGFGGFVGGVTAILLWLFATVLIWRESPAERVERLGDGGGVATLVCPTCGYNLTGLRELRCPECGAQYTLDQLVAAQPGRAAAAAAAELEA